MNKNPIRQQIQQLDQTSLESTLEAIANKGLLRRAKKDLQQGEPPTIITETAIAIMIRVAEAEVTIPEQGMAKARCNCPAVDACRHILMACLWLANDTQNPDHNQVSSISPTSSSDSDSQTGAGSKSEAQNQPNDPPQVSHQPPELLQYTMDDLVKWAGKKTVNAAIALLSSPDQTTEITEAVPIVIKIPKQNASCRFFPNSGLGGMICSCKSREVCRHLVLAVLAYQRSHGVIISGTEPQSQALSAASGAPRTRIQVLEAAQQLLRESIKVGLSHLSTSFQQRYTTLAVSATGVNLPRLSRSLRSIADDLQLISDRHAKADETRLFLTSARTYALCEAILQPMLGNQLDNQEPRPDLIGWHRTQYEDIGTLDLAGMGAYSWASASGYAGLTVLFWDINAKQWCSWSEARPVAQRSSQRAGQSFNPQIRYFQVSPWEGLSSPAEASQIRFKLMAAKRNHQNRLSAATQSHVTGITPLKFQKTHQKLDQDLDFGDRLFQTWPALQQFASSKITVGLKEYDPLNEIVIIQPTAWGAKSFDQVTQIFTWLVEDTNGAELPLQVPFSAIDTQRLRYLEALEPVNIWGIVGQIRRDRAGLALYPLSLLSTAIPPVINLSFATNSDQVATGASLNPNPDHLVTIEDEPSTPMDNPESNLEDFSETSEEISSDSSMPSGNLISNLEVQMSSLMGELQRLAEQGSDRFTTETSQLQLQTQIWESAGLKSIAQRINKLLEMPDHIPAHLLQLRYLCNLLWALKV